MKLFRIYADTSLFAGCFDEEFAEESQALFDEIRNGKFILVISTTLLRELDRAAEYVQRVLADVPAKAAEIIEYCDEIGLPRDAYVDAKVVDQNLDWMRNMLLLPA